MTHPTDEELIARANQVIEGNDKPTVILSRDEAAAMLRACKGRVRVKALEWFTHATDGSTLKAATGITEYVVWEIGGVGYLAIGSRSPGKAQEGDIEAAKSAAQADYEQRIIFALEPAPDHAEWDAAIEAAAKKCETHGVLGGPVENPYAEWKAHAENLAAVIRALKKGPTND